MHGFRRAALFGVLAGVFGAVAGAPAHAQNAADGVELVTAVVASVDGTPITLVDLEEFARGQGKLLAPDERASRSSMLEAMVRMKMFEAEFQRQGITASDSDVEIYIDNLMRETRSTRADVEDALAKIGLTWDDYFERMRQELQRMALINREIRARVNVTPEEVERHWREDEAYVQPERREVAHIYIPLPERATDEQVEETRALAARAYEAAQDDFADAAAEFSSGPNADEGGILGTFRRGEMAESFEAAVAGLGEGGVSRPFEAEGAFHILKLVRVVQPAREKLDDDTRAKIQERLYNESLDTRFKRWVDEDLVKRHHVTMQLDQLDELVGQGRS